MKAIILLLTSFAAIAIVAVVGVQSVNATNADSTADEVALKQVCSYEENQTTFGEFQSDFGGYFSRAATSDPDSVPGVLFKPLKWEKQVNAPPEKSALLMQMIGSSRVPDGLTAYVTGAYVLGYRKPGSEGGLSYDQSPESFAVLAALAFKDGVLIKMERTNCPK